jgi:YusW-like protein
MQATGATSQSDVRQLEIEVEMTSGEKREYEYEVDGDREKGKVEIRSSDGRKDKHGGEEAVQDTKRLMERVRLSRQMSPNEIIERVCAALDTSRDQIKKLVVEVEYADGTEVNVKVK